MRGTRHGAGKTHQIVNHDENAGLCMLDTLVIAIYFDPEPFALASIHLRIACWAHPGFGLQDEDPRPGEGCRSRQLLVDPLTRLPVGAVVVIVVQVNCGCLLWGTSALAEEGGGGG